MKSKNLSFGVFLLSIGVLWLLFNMDILDWSVLTALVTLWPLLLVMVGINIIFGNHPVVKAASWLVFLAVVVGYGYMNRDVPWPNNWGEAGNVSVEKEGNTRNGEVRLDLGGVRLRVGAEEKKLLDAYAVDSDIKHSIQYEKNNENVNVRFFKDKMNIFRGSRLTSDFRLNLNKDILWGMKVNLGAANGTLDLSGLKVKTLDVGAGAVDLDMIFGDNVAQSDVKINCGASKISVSIPDEVGVRVKFEGGLNKTNFNELGWEKRGGYYVSRNYDQAPHKIYFDVEMGAGKFDINPDKSVVKSSDTEQLAYH